MKNSLLLALFLISSLALYSQGYTLNDEINGERFGHFQLNFPWGIAVEPSDGKVYVAEYYNSRITILNEDGTVFRTINSDEGSAGTFTPLDIAVDGNGFFYVTDHYAARILVFESDGDFVRSFASHGTNDGQLLAPNGIALDSDDKIFISDHLDQKIHVFDNAGNFLFDFPLMANSHVYSISLDPDDNVYAADLDNNRVQVFSNNGNSLGVINLPSVPGEFPRPSALVVDQSFDVYVADYFTERIVKVTTPGNAPYHVVGGSVEVLREPENYYKQYKFSLGVDIARDGLLLVASGFLNQIERLDPTTGDQVGILIDDMEEGQLNYPENLAISPDGNIYVCDYANNRIQVFDASGEFLFKFGTSGVGNGKLTNPREIAIDNLGNVYVMDLSSIISRFDKDGNFLDSHDVLTSTNPDLGGIAVDDNFIYVNYSPSEPVNVYNKNWVYQRSIGTLGQDDGQIYRVQDIALDDVGNVYVANENGLQVFSNGGGYLKEYLINPFFARRVAVDEYQNVAVSNGFDVTLFDSDGTITQQLGSFNNPTGLVMRENKLYISESTKGRVLIYESILPIPALNFSNETVNYSELNHTLTASSDNPAPISFNVVEGDPASIITGNSIFLHSAGELIIEASQPASVNYRSVTTRATLTIEKSQLTVTADDDARPYGGENPQFTKQITGFRTGDNISQVDQLPVCTTTATLISPTGNYNITPTGGSAINYEFNYVSGILTVEKAPLIATAENKSRLYGEDNPGFTVQYVGFVNGDTFSDLNSQPIASTNANTTSPVGDYPIELDNASDNNYEIEYVTGQLTIGKASLIVTIENASRIYGDENPEFTAQYDGFVNNDGISDIDTPPTLSGPDELSPVGEYFITAINGLDNNYDFVSISGVLTITKAPLTATAEDQSREYKTENPEFTIEYEGFKNDDDASDLETEPSGSTSATLSSPVGDYVIVLTGGVSANYEFTFVNGQLTITKANQQISFGPLPSPVFSTLPPFALQATSDSELPISYIIKSGPATVATNIVTLSGEVGIVTIEATQTGNGNYEAANPVSQSFEVVLAPVVGIEDEDAGLKVYPNPSKGKFWLSSPEGIHAYQILNGNGVLIKQQNDLGNEDHFVDIESLSDGIYILVAQTHSGKKLTRKIAIVK